MSVKAIEKEHVTKHRNGSTSHVLLSAYRKKGEYKVSRGPNTVDDEVSVKTLDDVLPYLAKGYLIRMRSEIETFNGRRKRIEGLYGSSEVRIVS